MNGGERDFRFGILSYLSYTISTLAVLLLSVPLVLFLALIGFIKLLYPLRKEQR